MKRSLTGVDKGAHLMPVLECVPWIIYSSIQEAPPVLAYLGWALHQCITVFLSAVLINMRKSFVYTGGWHDSGKDDLTL